MLVAIGDHPNPMANKRGTTELRQYVSSEQDLALKYNCGTTTQTEITCSHWLLLGKWITHEHTWPHTHTCTVYVATTVALNTYTHSMYIHIRPIHSTETHSRYIKRMSSSTAAEFEKRRLAVQMILKDGRPR